MREPRKRQQAAAAARNNVAPAARSTNLMDMPLDEFQGALAELAQQGVVDTDALLRQYRAANSPFAAVNRAAEASSADLAAAGRRPVAGSAGLLSRPIDDAGGVRFEPAAGLLGMLAGAGKQIDAPMAAYQELIPAEDMDLEALGTASLATLGGGAAVGPRNLLNYDPDTISAFGATAGPAKPYADIDVIDPRDLIGARISPTPADLTRAGSFYEGIDSAGTNRRTPLLGGPLFPTQELYSDANIAWLVNSASKGATKLGKDSDFVTVTAMSPRAHQSNASVADAYMGTLEAYINSGRLPEQSVVQLSDVVRNFGRTTTDPELQRLSEFVGFDSPNFNEFMQNATFPQRETISKLMASPASQAIGGPNMQKVLDATIQPEFAGSNLGDTLLLLELDKRRGLLNLADEGLPEHMSYDTGLGGRVVGRFENPAARGLVYPEFEAEYSARPTMVNKSGGLDEARMAYSFGRALPTETVTPEGARNLNEAMQNYGFEQPQQARLIQEAIANNWRKSTTPKTQGGISPVDFERALLRNPSLPSLEPYTAADVRLGAKSGDFEVFQLGDADVFFGLKKSPDYSWMNNGDPVPGLSQDEVGLSAVVSNEMGARGVASPAILGKAIEEGVTVLDAFAVPSERFPQGFLPSTYGNYGFDEVTRIPFSKEFYIQDRGQDAFDDLTRQWRSEGWDENKGFPDVVLMKWRGTDAERENAGTKVFEQGFEGFGSGQDFGSVRSTGQNVEPGLLSTIEGRPEGADIGRGDTGPVRASGGPYQPHRLRGAAETLTNLTPLQRKNLGLLGSIMPSKEQRNAP